MVMAPASDPTFFSDLAASGDWANSGPGADVSSLLATAGQDQGGLPQRQQQDQGGGWGAAAHGVLGALLSIPKAALSIPQAYAAAYGDIPDKVKFAHAQRQLGMMQAIQQYKTLGTLLDFAQHPEKYQGGGGTGALPQNGQTGPAPGLSAGPSPQPAPGAGAQPGPAPGGGGPPAVTAAASPGVPSAPPPSPGLPQQDQGYAPGQASLPPAMRGLLFGLTAFKDPDKAAAMMEPNAVPDRESGIVHDSKTGRILWQSPRYQYVNNQRVNPYDPNAPDYIPQLGPGIGPDGQGGVGTVKGYTQAQADIQAAEAGGKAAGTAPFEKITVNVGGVPYDMNPQQWANYQRTGQLPGAPGGAAGGGAPGLAPAAAGGPPGVAGISKPQETFDVGQAADAQKTLSADMNTRQGALVDRDNARSALAYIQANPARMNQALPFQVAGANYLRSLPPSVLQAVGLDPKNIDQLANDAATYNRLSSGGLLTFAKSNLPSRYTERELALGRPIIGTLSTAPDAATYHWGLQQAMADKQLQRSEFAANYKGAPSRQAIEQAWNASPQGKASLYEDPGWQHLKIGGQPAVQFFPDRNAQRQLTGRTVGVIGAGTSAPQTFYPSWSK